MIAKAVNGLVAEEETVRTQQKYHLGISSNPTEGRTRLSGHCSPDVL